MMKTLNLCLAAAILLPMSLAASATEEGTLDLRRGVPADVYMAVYGKHNPERDFQRQHFEEVWKTIKETKILEKALQIVTSRMSQNDVEQAQAVLKEVETSGCRDRCAGPAQLPGTHLRSVAGSRYSEAEPAAGFAAPVPLAADTGVSDADSGGNRAALALVEKHSQVLRPCKRPLKARPKL